MDQEIEVFVVNSSKPDFYIFGETNYEWYSCFKFCLYNTVYLTT